MAFDSLYRLFYVVFSMDLAAVVLFPVVLVLRFILRDMHRKYMVWIWRLYFFRIVCPIAISSVFSAVPMWNRMYHQALASLGLALKGDYGLLTGWHTVYETEIVTTVPYRIFAMVWFAGGVLLCGITCFRQGVIRREVRRGAVLLDGRIRQSAVQTPVMLGLFRSRYYLPRQMEARQLRYLLPHLEAHRSRKSLWWRLSGFLILLLHWYNPLVWMAYILANRDEEMACDDLAVRRLGEREALSYAQNLLNLAKEEVLVPYSISALFEADLEKRAARMLYYRRDTARRGLSALLLISLLALWTFGLRPLQIAWDGGTWGQGADMEPTKSLETVDAGEVVGKCGVSSPNGLPFVLRLVMTKGEHADNQYKGKFTLELLDSMGDVLDSVSLKQSWSEKGMSAESMVFSDGLSMQTGDFNGDGAQEIMLGQRQNWSTEQAKTVQDMLFPVEQAAGEREYIYLMYHVGETELKVVSEPIFALGDQHQETRMPFTEEGIDDLFAVPVPRGKNYYVWDMDGMCYRREKMTQEMLNQHKEASKGTAETGVRDTKTLSNSKGNVQMTVETRNDTTGSPEIQSISVGSKEKQKKMDKLDGYYCDLKWAVSEDGEDDRYAVLTYNGTRAQTFAVYDVQEKVEYYRQEDGNSVLADAFRQYNGSEISFADGGVAVYGLQSRKGDTLTISFAADADGGRTVRGSYQYSLKNNRVMNLSFSQTMETEKQKENEDEEQ